MKKQFLLLTMLAGALTIGNAQITFSDANFKQALIDDGVDTSGDGEISVAEAQAETSLVLSNKEIDDVNGIEYFTNLTFLSLYENNLSDIDISKNTKLTYLNVGRNDIEEIDISKNINLITFSSIVCDLIELDVTNNTKLRNLTLQYNNIEEINITNNVELVSFNINNNNIREIDVTNNINLTELIVSTNELTEIDVTNNINLTELSIGTNDITEVDVTNNINLIDLNINSISIEEIDITNNTELETLSSLYNSLTDIDLSNNSKLEILNLVGNDLTEIDLSNQTVLRSLFIQDNNLTTLDVRYCSIGLITFSSNPSLEKVFMSGQPLGYDFYRNDEVNVRLSDCPNLEFICVDDEYVDSINNLLEEENTELEEEGEQQINVTVSSDCIDGGAALQFSDVLTLWPNPTTTGELNISVNDFTGSEDVTLRFTYIYTLEGASMGASFHEGYYTTPSEASMSFPYLPEGTYIIEVTTTAGIFSSMFVKL